MKRTLTIFSLAAFAYFSLAAFASLGFGQAFSDGFENANYAGNTPAGGTVASTINWEAINRSTPVGTGGWFDGSAAVFAAHGGIRYIAVNFNSTSGANLIDNWLISDVRTLHNGDSISFWSRTVRSPVFADRLRLRLSTSGASSAAADFKTVLLSVNEGLTVAGYPNEWTQFTANIFGLGGPTVGRFAFAYQIPNGGPQGSNSDLIGIDDVVYTPVPEPAPGDFNFNGEVDAADYVLWRKGLGTVFVQTDYDIWRAHFGQTAGTGSSQALTAVPEPAACLMLSIAIVLRLWCYRVGKHNGSELNGINISVSR